ncbi:hypothetical protein QGN29_02330 [Temperatibacter marinus]|uniref:Uncharacterized protein n=1 Tax=Temperatibacter marinus TaxID=1456591 RepID=A0AA52H9R9_9PROT|nr:hypothetical protein [Temperatibacter marinus]WND03204.1 hypothetical protein QGN29_02330 [Temperatibacter marinus]
MNFESAKFIVGLGAQKAATTWLSYYLESTQDVLFGPTKELHHFSRLYLPYNFHKFLENFKRKVTSIGDISGDNIKQIEDIKNDAIHLDALTDIEKYYDLFRCKYTGQKYFADISPSYALI